MSAKRPSHKSTKAVTIVVLVAFLAFVALSVFSILNITSVVDDKVIADKGGVPELWADTATVASDVESDITTKIINDSYIEYTVKVKNIDQNRPLYLTHLSTYVTEANKDGFVPLNGSLEYTFDKEGQDDWVASSISNPGNDENASKFDGDIYISENGGTNDTIYFRYMVIPSDEGQLDDKVSILAKDVSGDRKIIVVTNEIEYQKPDDVRLAAEAIVRADPTAAKQDPNDESGEYAKPLGVVSDAIIAAAISLSSLGSLSLMPDSFNGNIMLIVVALGVFVITLVVYLIVRGRVRARSLRESK